MTAIDKAIEALEKARRLQSEYPGADGVAMFIDEALSWLRPAPAPAPSSEEAADRWSKAIVDLSGLATRLSREHRPIAAETCDKAVEAIQELRAECLRLRSRPTTVAPRVLVNGL